MQRRMKIRSLITIFFLLLAFGISTTLAIKYWIELETLNKLTISLGSNEEVKVEVVDLTSDFQGALVPEGHAYFQGEVEEIILEYHVSINKSLLQKMNLSIEAMDIKIDNNTKYAHLVKVMIMDSEQSNVIDIGNEEVIVTVRVMLLEPIDAKEAAELGKVANVENSEEAFQAIRDKKISFILRFKVEPK